ncbi:DUF2264 domain-containing protein [Enterococcus sp. JM9B]|uniref:DUF2264 domain-containing protein n=1 Tax=Enterococcus sp. JM9B TaxID=1857216 RepID=UPI001374DA00|nr:DUF2264 domain-containing protein [Enterococcus sp. JM9B]KAF1303125.1 hypothetical protein BAU16_05465 [Enterococcus sp. JM9B]
MDFCKENLDYNNSPYTGLTRDSWKEAGKFILSGIFQSIFSVNDSIVLPRREKEVTYPHDEKNSLEKISERFEGLARSFFIAAPLIHDDPSLRLNEIKVSDYYKEQIVRSCTRNDSLCVGLYDDLLKEYGADNPSRTFQQTVESAALVIGLWMSKEQIWDSYTSEEKDIIVTFIEGYGYGNTITNNWQLFNMLDLAFLHMEGYSIDKVVMKKYAEEILAFYAGDGWYRDGHTFDYYSCWAFNLYAPIWNLWYGYENEPQIAAKFEEYANIFMKTFPDMFDEEGFVNMWGRSMIYRNAPTAAFFGNLLLKKNSCNFGLARKICSGALRQFFDREDTFLKGIPTLGFYRQFVPMLQGYSCAASPLWLGKAFMILYLPESHPFWQAKEENGSWGDNEMEQVKRTTLNGPALSFSNHFANGETLLRSGKVLRNMAVVNDMWGYAKLCFNTRYPWEATPAIFLESQQYVLQDLSSGHYERGNFIAWSGERKGILYRRLFFDFATPKEYTWINKLDLADFPVSNGLIRVDKPHFLRRSTAMTLGSFGFPDNGTKLSEISEGDAKAIILKGYDHNGNEKQMVMTIYKGWDNLAVYRSKGTNPDSLQSIIIFAKVNQKTPMLLISQILTKKNHEDFAVEEIFPIEEVDYDEASDAAFQITIKMKNGENKKIDYSSIEGNLQI